jgi:hypothetical protein
VFFALWYFAMGKILSVASELFQGYSRDSRVEESRFP